MNKEFNEEIILNELKQNIFIKDEDSKFIFVNKAYADLIGVSPSQMIGRSDYDFFPKEIAQNYVNDDIKVIRNRVEIDTKKEIVINNEKRIIRAIKKPLLTDGKVYGVLGIFWDVTEYTLEQQAYIKLQNGLNKAQELAQIGHWELDLAGGSLFWSDEVYRIFGREPQSFGATYEAFLNYIHPDDRELVNQSYTNSVNERKGYHITHRVIKESGEIVYVEERCEHEFDENFNVIRSIGTVHDITKQKIAQNELLLSSEVFAKMSDGVIITDAENKIIKVNEAFTKITGYSEDEAIGNQPNMLSSGWHSQEFYQSMWNSIEETDQYSGEIEDRKKNGETYISDITIISLQNDDGILTNYISIFSDVTEKKAKDELIHNLAYYDHLTDLPNRMLFQERFLEKEKYAKRNKKKMAMLFLDMDNFKNVNDTLGHTVGDKFLIEVVKILKETLRSQDTIARQGGDEFTILIDNFDYIEEILPVVEKIVNKFKEPVNVEGIKLYTGVSVGISIYPDDGNDFTTLVKSADTAMYHVKENGKSNFHFFTEGMNKQMMQRIELENKLRNAISNDEFFLVYQPKVDTKLEKVYGMEALIRWQSVDGLIPPDKFISVAEEMGLIYEIGLWVIEKSLSDLKNLHNDGNILTLSINVSSIQFENENFIEDLNSAVKSIGIRSNYIELEITETQIMGDIEKTLMKLNYLHSLGFQMSIDDFGTGYSSLSYLKKLPAQTIKIDRSFVLDIDKNNEDKSIVGAIIAMARTLGKDVIAEGSETKEHIETLRDLDCHKIQGYYFSKPLEIGAFKSYISYFKSNEN